MSSEVREVLAGKTSEPLSQYIQRKITTSHDLTSWRHNWIIPIWCNNQHMNSLNWLLNKISTTQEIILFTLLKAEIGTVQTEEELCCKKWCRKLAAHRTETQTPLQRNEKDKGMDTSLPATAWGSMLNSLWSTVSWSKQVFSLFTTEAAAARRNSPWGTRRERAENKTEKRVI